MKIISNFNPIFVENKEFRNAINLPTSNNIKKYSVKINPDKENHLDKISYVLISQAFASDISMLKNKLGSLSREDVLKIQLEYVKYVTD
jgi:mRNA-degrading endonuclease toxin of MazEF toxin-antitoxin module